jgi:hypothetical protein
VIEFDREPSSASTLTTGPHQASKPCLLVIALNTLARSALIHTSCRIAWVDRVTAPVSRFSMMCQPVA